MPTLGGVWSARGVGIASQGCPLELLRLADPCRSTRRHQTATVGTVVVDWVGLTPPGSYLGAVSHRDGTTNFGLTLVEVDS